MMKTYRTETKKMRIDFKYKDKTGLNTHNSLSAAVSHNIILSVNDKPKLNYIFFAVYR